MLETRQLCKDYFSNKMSLSIYLFNMAQLQQSPDAKLLRTPAIRQREPVNLVLRQPHVYSRD